MRTLKVDRFSYPHIDSSPVNFRKCRRFVHPAKNCHSTAHSPLMCPTWSWLFKLLWIIMHLPTVAVSIKYFRSYTACKFWVWSSRSPMLSFALFVSLVSVFLIPFYHPLLLLLPLQVAPGSLNIPPHLLPHFNTFLFLYSLNVCLLFSQENIYFSGLPRQKLEDIQNFLNMT